MCCKKRMRGSTYTRANFSFYTWLSNLDILCTRRPCKLSITDAGRKGRRRKRKPVSKKVVTRKYFCDEGHWLSDTQLEASFALWSDKKFKKKKSFSGILSDIESQLLYSTYVYSFSSTSCIALRFEKLFHHILRCLTLLMIEWGRNKFLT